MEIVLPIQFTKKSNKTAQIDDHTVTVNNFFGHWFTDIDIRRYPDDMRILPANNSVDIYQYPTKILATKSCFNFFKNLFVLQMLIEDQIMMNKLLIDLIQV